MQAAVFILSLYPKTSQLGIETLHNGPEAHTTARFIAVHLTMQFSFCFRKEQSRR
jgi:hypothetical protein